MAERSSGKKRREESSPRTAARQAAAQVLYALEHGGDWSDAAAERALARYWSYLEGPPEGRTFCEELIRGASRERDAMDQVLRASAPNWRLERMAAVDRAVLRLGCFELLHSDVPAEVILDEAIELARLYGGAESPGFVNGVLDRIARDHQRVARKG